MQLPAGEGLNLNPSLWLGFLQEHCGVDATQAHVLRKRLITKILKILPENACKAANAVLSYLGVSVRWHHQRG